MWPRVLLFGFLFICYFLGVVFYFFFFFQAEDGIRYLLVTGVPDVCSSDLSSTRGAWICTAPLPIVTERVFPTPFRTTSRCPFSSTWSLNMLMYSSTSSFSALTSKRRAPSLAISSSDSSKSLRGGGLIGTTSGIAASPLSGHFVTGLVIHQRGYAAMFPSSSHPHLSKIFPDHQ